MEKQKQVTIARGKPPDSGVNPQIRPPIERGESARPPPIDGAESSGQRKDKTVQDYYTNGVFPQRYLKPVIKKLMKDLNMVHTNWGIFYKQFDTSYLFLENLERPENLRVCVKKGDDTTYTRDDTIAPAEAEARDMNFVGWIILELKFGKENQVAAKRWADESPDPLASVVRRCLSKNPPPAKTLLEQEPYFQDIGAVACYGWAKLGPNPSLTLNRTDIQRRPVGPFDLLIYVDYCGICSVDVYYTQKSSQYPLVPGHEIIGIVAEKGTSVEGFELGQHVAVGSYVDSCRNCVYCNENLEQFCSKVVPTFGGKNQLQGGFSTYIVVDERFCFHVPKTIPPASVAPLICHGVSIYTPMKSFNREGWVGVVGSGYVAALAIRMAKALGLKVAHMDGDPSKRGSFGADKFILTSNKAELKRNCKVLDYIICPVPCTTSRNCKAYLKILNTGGRLFLLGHPDVQSKKVKIDPKILIRGARSMSGCYSGGPNDTREMLTFCASNDIIPQVEIFQMAKINEAIERLQTFSTDGKLPEEVLEKAFVIEVRSPE